MSDGIVRVLEAERKGRQILDEAQKNAAEMLARGREEADRVRASAGRILAQRERDLLQEVAGATAPEVERIRAAAQSEVRALEKRAQENLEAALDLLLDELLPGSRGGNAG